MTLCVFDILFILPNNNWACPREKLPYRILPSVMLFARPNLAIARMAILRYFDCTCMLYYNCMIHYFTIFWFWLCHLYDTKFCDNLIYNLSIHGFLFMGPPNYVFVYCTFITSPLWLAFGQSLWGGFFKYFFIINVRPFDCTANELRGKVGYP